LARVKCENDSDLHLFTSLELKIERKDTNKCLGGLRMEDRGVQNPQTFLLKNFSTFNRRENMTIGAFSSKF